MLTQAISFLKKDKKNPLRMWAVWRMGLCKTNGYNESYLHGLRQENLDLRNTDFLRIKFHCITFQNIFKNLHSLKLFKNCLLRWIFKIMMSSRQKTTPLKSSITWEIHIDNWLFISFWHVATLNYQSTCIFVFWWHRYICWEDYR